MGWYQLTYASVEKSPERPGGWGIVAASPDLPADARSRLLDGVTTRIDELVATEEFALRGALDARVRCFSYRPAARGGSWWHAVVAGKDATGRPGNVFTHAITTDVIDPPLRPVDLWRSKDWLTPFGAAEVAAVELGEAVEPRPAGQSGVDFALGQPRAAVEAVLSAVVSCFQDHRALVLAAGSTDEFIDWLRAISSLTSASVAAQIPFCTYVRADSLYARVQQFEILGLPREDLPVLLASLSSEPVGPLVLDVSRLPDGPSSDDWEYADQRWNGGDRWLDAYFVLSEDHAPVDETIRLMDEVTQDVTLEDQLSPEWPLALALLRRDGAAHSDADDIIAEWRRLRPFDGLTDPVLVELLGVREEPVAPDPLEPGEGDSSEDQISFGELVDRLSTARSEEQWIAAADGVAHARPQLTWDELPNALSMVTGVGWVWGTDLHHVPATLRPAFREWLRVAPFLAVRESLAGAERAPVGDMVLLALGVSPPERASEVQTERVAELLESADHHPAALVELLETWQQRYQELSSNKLEQGRA